MRSIVEYVHEHAVKSPSRLCLIDDNSSVTYSEYWIRIKKTAMILKEHGVDEGANVVIESAQNITYLSLELALHLLHAIFIPLEKNCGHKKIIDIAKNTNAVLIISDQNILNFPIISYKQLADELENKSCYENYLFPEEDDVSEILFSTGTTGTPKGIVLTHKNDVALAENVINGVKMEADTIEIIPVPLNHSHGLRRYYGNMVNGSTVIVMNGVLDINRFFRYLDIYHATAIDLVPSSLSVILKLSKDKIGDYRSQIRYIQLGSAPLHEEDKARLCLLLPDTRLYNFYGSTESGCTCILNFNDGVQRQHCIGKPTINAEFITVDDNGNIFKATAEKPGLLASKGPMNMQCYYEDKKETAKVLIDGYVYTSDLGYISNDYVFLVGRKGDVINVGGNKVAPQEIEELALKYPLIKDCACIAIPDKLKGFVPKLFIVIEQNEHFSVKDFGDYLNANLEMYKVPKSISKINEIPRTFNGKIMRSELQKLGDK